MFSVNNKIWKMKLLSNFMDCRMKIALISLSHQDTLSRVTVIKQYYSENLNRITHSLLVGSSLLRAFLWILVRGGFYPVAVAQAATAVALLLLTQAPGVWASAAADSQALEHRRWMVVTLRAELLRSTSYHLCVSTRHFSFSPRTFPLCHVAV